MATIRIQNIYFKLDLSNEAQEVIREKGLDLKLCTPGYLKYYVRRLPVLVTGFDFPDPTDEEDNAEAKEIHQKDCSQDNPCKTCKKIKKMVLRPSSEETEEETSYLSSEETDTDWDDPHNGEHPDCDECEEIRADNENYQSIEEYDMNRNANTKCEWESDGSDFCDDPECIEHGAGDKEAEEEPPGKLESDEDKTRLLNSDEADEIIEVIERLQRETEKASGLAANALRGLKATNKTTQAVKNHLEKEMVKQAETYRSISSDYSQLSADNARVREQAEKVKSELSKIKSEARKIVEGDTKWTHHHQAPGKVKDFVCLEEIERKINCSCNAIDKENSRLKMNHAIQGLKDAIQSQNSGAGKTIKSGNKTYVNCHKAHGQKILVIIRYVVTLPGIDEEVKEIWRNLRESSNVITRRDLIKISCILSRYAKAVEDGLLVEHDRAMYSADIDFYRQSESENLKRQAETSIRDDIVDDFSTDEDPIEILNSTSRAYREATGARPRTRNQSGKPGHYTIEPEDRKFKQELKRRNELEAIAVRSKELKEERLKKLNDWDVSRWSEITEMANAKMESLCTKANAIAHELERKKARSARRAAIHSRPRNREKVKIPAPPGDN